MISWSGTARERYCACSARDSSRGALLMRLTLQEHCNFIICAQAVYSNFGTQRPHDPDARMVTEAKISELARRWGRPCCEMLCAESGAVVLGEVVDRFRREHEVQWMFDTVPRYPVAFDEVEALICF